MTGTSQWQRRKGVMLAYPFEEKRLAKWEPPYIVQPKLDGVRCRVKDGILLSSEENEIISVPHINRELERMDNQLELDGELYVHGWNFEQIVSVTSRTASIHPDFEKMEYHVFDTATDEQPQAQRIVELGVVKEHCHFAGCPIRLVPTAVANSLQDVMDIYNDFVGMGYEGIVVRHYLAPYIRRRSTYMMKFKPKKSDIYLIVGWKEEISKDGDPKGRLGALVCQSDQNEFSVGTGLTDEMRSLLWQGRFGLAGKYCHVEYQHTTPGKGVPRFPVFVKVVETPYEQ